MSVMCKDGCKVILPRSGRDDSWIAIRRHYARASKRKWKQLAILWLRVYSDWPLDQISCALGLSRGHVVRSLRLIREELRDHLLATPEMLAELNDTELHDPPLEAADAERESP